MLFEIVEYSLGGSSYKSSNFQIFWSAIIADLLPKVPTLRLSKK